jgi:hypothetical protein
MVIIVKNVVIIMKFILEIQIVVVNAMRNNITELRYNRLISELENIEKKRIRKIKQIQLVRKKLGMTD